MLAILGLGTFLPPVVRRNDAWPPEVLAAWQAHGAFSPERAEEATGVFLEGEGPRRVFEAMRALAGDPFHGSHERRVMPEGMTAVDMAAAAARDAMAAAQVAPGDIDFVLDASFAPDLINAPEACGVHAALGLRPRCFSVTVDAVCNSFQAQLAMAEGLVASGRFRCGLLLQTAATSRVTPMSAPMSVHFGDGASAAVVGAGARRGVVAQRFETESDLYRALAVTVPGANWWDDGRVWSTPVDKAAARRMMPVAPDAARRLIHDLLGAEGVALAEVDFFACHQATVWFRRVLQDHVGLVGARSLDTYPTAGSVSAANLPLVLAQAEAQGLLRAGDRVVLFQGSTGATYAATLLRW